MCDESAMTVMWLSLQLIQYCMTFAVPFGERFFLVNKLVESSGHKFPSSSCVTSEGALNALTLFPLLKSRGNGRQSSQRVQETLRERESESESRTLSKTVQWLEANVRHWHSQWKWERERHSTHLKDIHILYSMWLGCFFLSLTENSTRALRTSTNWVAFDSVVSFFSMRWDNSPVAVTHSRETGRGRERVHKHLNVASIELTRQVRDRERVEK